MPTSTFINLPTQKREKLLTAARAEFARVPYAEASINRMIQAAGIPRGSFYMYFRDKSELFSYLVSEYSHYIGDFLAQLLHQHGGDLFATLLALFDFVQSTGRDPIWRQIYDHLIQIVEINGPAVLGTFIEQAGPAVLRVFTDQVDRGRLDLRSDADLEDLLRALLTLSCPHIRDAILSPDPLAARRRYANTLVILARGMGKANKGV